MNIRIVKGFVAAAAVWAIACGSSSPPDAASEPTGDRERVSSVSSALTTCQSSSDCTAPATCVNGTCQTSCAPSNPCNGFNCGTFYNGCQNVQCGCSNGLVCSGSSCVASCASYPKIDDCRDGCGNAINERGSCTQYGHAGTCYAGTCEVPDCSTAPDLDDCRDGCGNPTNDYEECFTGALGEPGRCVYGICEGGT